MKTAIVTGYIDPATTEERERAHLNALIRCEIRRSWHARKKAEAKAKSSGPFNGIKGITTITR